MHSQRMSVARRPPPSPLRLAQSTPPRGTPKHVMPERPRPAIAPLEPKPRALAVPAVAVLPDAGTLRTSLGRFGGRPGPWDAGYAFGRTVPAARTAISPPPRAAVNLVW